MCVSSPIYPVILGKVRGACQILTDPDWKAEDESGAQATCRTRGGNKNDDDNQGGDMPSLMFKEESNRGETKNRDSKKKADWIKENDKIHPLKVKEAMSNVDKSTTEELQKTDSTLKKCFDRVGKPTIRENYVG